MAEAKTPPTIVSQRNHFTPLEEIVDQMLDGFDPDHNVLPKARLREWGLHIAKRVSRACEQSFTVAAGKGITQARLLIEDPTYYSTIRERRKRAALADAEYQRRQQIERLEQDHDPKFRERRITDLRKWIDENREQGRCLEARLTEYLEFCGTPPKLIRMEISEKDDARLPGEPVPGKPERVK